MLPLKRHLFFNKATFMHKVQNNKSPNYIVDLFKANVSPYTPFKLNLSCPKPRIDLYKSSISYTGAHTWNSLPLNLKLQHRLCPFKRSLHRHLSNDLLT